jgi:glycerol-3-phosphate acyltransferase PlsY
MTIVYAAAAVAIAYLLGSLPMGVFAARLVKGVEIREIGSGRTGATNAYRAAGPWGAAITSAGDIFKGVVAVWLARFLMMLAPANGWSPWIMTLAGIAAVVGHNYSIFLKFKGGAGTVTTIGVLAAMNPWIAVVITVVGMAAIAISRMASIGSITVAVLMSFALVISAAFRATPWAYVLFGVAGGTLTVLALRPNIGRILTKQERELKTNY